MNQTLLGKKLLVLGAGAVEISLVKRAQAYGVHVIVTDYNQSHIISPAKDIADEYWDIDWSDIDSLEMKCRIEAVDGVIAGYSEFRVENCIKLCERLGLPCYATLEQLEVTRDKIKFKDACRASGIPVIKEYPDTDSVDMFPVIVKPTDRAGSIGISIAKNRIELENAFRFAMEKSVCKRVIIEQYITDSNKFDAYYAVVDGEIMFLSTDDVFFARNNGNKRVVQSGWVLPSVHQVAFIEKHDTAMRNFISSQGIKNGYLFFSGFVDKNNNFLFFECGFRLCGGHLYNYFPLIGEVDNLDLFIFHALTGSAANVLKNRYRSKNQNIKCVTLNYYAKKGTIAEIKGFSDVEKMENCCFSLQTAYIGEKCSDSQAILSKIGTVYFCNDSAEKLSEDVRKCNRLICAVDVDGNDMINDRVTPEEIRDWWKELQ